MKEKARRQRSCGHGLERIRRLPPQAPPGGAPAPPGARSGASRIKWDRVGRIALVLVLFAVAYSYLNPAIDLFKTYQSTTAAKAEFHTLLHENKRLHHAIQSRRRTGRGRADRPPPGPVGEGETPFVLHGLR